MKFIKYVSLEQNYTYLYCCYVLQTTSRVWAFTIRSYQ